MSRAYKNFWSLNTDEAVVTGILRDAIGNNGEVLMPLNAQMKGVDLVALNIKSKKVITIQVKGSRAFEPRKSEVKKYGDGSPGWFWFSKDVVDKATADWFIFLVYVIEQLPKSGRRVLVPHTITIPTEVLQNLATKHKKHRLGDRYNFTFWINPTTKDAFDMKDNYSVSEYLDNRGFEKFNKVLI